MPVRNTALLQPGAHVAARRAGQQHEELGRASVQALEHCEQDLGALIGLGSRLSTQPTPSFQNEPTTCASRGTP